MEKERFILSQVSWHGIGADTKARYSSFWKDFESLSQNAKKWYGRGNEFKNISFNVLGVENGIAREVTRKNDNLESGKIWGNKIKGRQFDVKYEYKDGKSRMENDVGYSFGTYDPRDEDSSSESGFDTGPRQLPDRLRLQKPKDLNHNNRDQNHRQRLRPSLRSRSEATWAFRTHNHQLCSQKIRCRLMEIKAR